MAEPFTRASLAGAVDLSSLRDKAQAGNNPAPAPAQAQPSSAPANYPTTKPGAGIPVAALVIDGGVENLRELLALSNEIAVLVDFKTATVPGSAEMTVLLEKLTVELAGRIVLVRIDSDAQPKILEAFQLRQGGVAVALVKGQPVPLISAELDET
ncbi:MAG: hypothetical protein KGL77_06575, partial [Actinomycetales bacterium]|nr:hypothetical protein [Actinomycetales bacterium]